MNMDELYGKEYYDQYDVGVGKVNYKDSVYTKDFLTQIANRIVDDFHPTTVLDAGCAMGHLVAALRDRGVEAYGIDISKYAISMVRADIKPYCVVGSLTEPLPETVPQRYDLVVTIEVLEHLYAEDGKKAIENLCRCSDRILFSSTPDDVTEHTHVNVQQREYWARLFAKEGFFDDLTYRPTYLTYYASMFKKSTDWLRQVEDYERNIRLTEEHLKIQGAEWAKALEDKARYIQIQNAQLAEVMAQQDECKKKLAEAQYAYSVISNAAAWKMTKPLRVLLDWIKSIPFFALIIKGLKCWKGNGWRYTWKKVKERFYHRHQYVALAVNTIYTQEELEVQRRGHFPRKIKFSIVVPLYNTPEPFLREMIQSVLDQTYADWELCMADGSDAAHGDVQKICRAYARKDPRIHYQKLEKNLGISGNTNACLEMATGDYIALLDHDDLLHPAALHDVMRAICEQDADFIYTDEGIFHNQMDDCFDYHFKSDYAPDTLRSVNYICHLSVFSRGLLDAVGYFRPECDGSQDFDMILRLTEKAEKIVHVPKLLYFWRSHSDSTAGDVGSKPYVLEAGHRALQDHMRRVGLKGEVLDTVIPTMYRVCYEIEGKPLVSILIPNQDHVEDLKKCVNSIIKKTTYSNYEIIIIENNSKTKDIDSYYDELESNERIKVVRWQGKIFNFSALNNFGARFADGEYYLLLNNDTEVITPDWIQEMLMFNQRKDVGIVGAKLYYPDDTIQHAGVIVGIGSTAGHQHKGAKRTDYGFLGRLIYAQNLSAVTGACLMIRRDVWKLVKGLDEESFAIAFNDVDICLRVRKAGYLIVWTPFAELYHYESKSRGYEDTPEKKKRFSDEVHRFQERWAKELAAGDPYYNPNLTLDREDFSVR